MNQQELNLQQRKAAIEQKLIQSGQKDRLLDYLRQKLVQSGWKDELKNYCKELIRNKGLDRISVQQLTEELKPRARATVPPKAKEELLARIKNFIENNPQQMWFLIAVVQAALTVNHPQSLINWVTQKYTTNKIPVSLANYGHIPYGTLMLSKICIPKSQKFGCQFIDVSDCQLQEQEVFSVVVEMGGCLNTMKSAHVQEIGGKATILVHPENIDITQILIDNDGNGGSVQIPTLVVSKEDGDRISESSQEVFVSIDFQLPKKQEKVSLEFFMSSNNKRIREFLESVSVDMDYSKIDFRPVYPHYTCSSCQDGGFIDDQNKECLSGGRYCVTDPDLTGYIIGQQIVFQDIRQICVFRQTDKFDWYSYVMKFNSMCLREFNSGCSDRVLQEVGIDFGKINLCIQESIDGRDMYLDDNFILKEENQYVISSGVRQYPAIVINGVPYRGNWEFEEIKEAICDGFLQTPQCCKYEVIVDFQPGDGDNNFWVFGLIAVLALIVLIGGVAYVKVKTRKEFKEAIEIEVKLEAARYFALKDSNFLEDQVNILVEKQ